MNTLITGTAQGIGFELTKIALQNGHHVLAIARSAENSQKLIELKKHSPHLEIFYCDLSKEGAEKEIHQAAQKFASLDLLINNAGVYYQGETREDFEKSFLINTITPFLMTKELLPLLKKSKAPKAAHISSLMGSITDNLSGGSHAYRSSKTALNMLMKGLSIEEKWLATLCLHPGWVQTRMGGEAAPVEPIESVKGLWKVMDDFSLHKSGSFVDFKGKELPW
jgi:NAD(P)-dependent dehydrogenase (short-subunit alcohol dehydrogenase family)